VYLVSSSTARIPLWDLNEFKKRFKDKNTTTLGNKILAAKFLFKRMHTKEYIATHVGKGATGKQRCDDQTIVAVESMYSYNYLL